MDLSKFTEKSQAALQEAQNIATRNQHQAVAVEHLMLALIEQEGGLVPRLFEKAKVAPDLLRARVEEELNRIPRVSGDTTTGQGIYVTQRINQLLVKAQDEAKEHVAREGYDPVYGARPLKRFLQRAIESPLARKIVAGEVPDNTQVVVDKKGRELVFRTQPLKAEELKEAA